MANSTDTQEPDEVSLNAGYELEEETPVVPEAPAGDLSIKEPIDPKAAEADSIPSLTAEILPNVDLFVGLEAAINDLLYLVSDIEQSHGMSQQFALEAERLVPGFGGGVPLGFYTKDPSATRYRVSLEEISKNIWVLIAAAIAACIAAVAAFVKWFRGNKDGTPEEAVAQLDAEIKAAEANEETLEKIGKLAHELAGQISSGNVSLVTEEGKPPKRITMSSLLDDLFTDETRHEAAKKFLSSTDPIFHDIINRGEYSQDVRSLIPAIQQANDLLRQKVQILEQVRRKDIGSSDLLEKGQNLNMLAVAEKPIEVSFGHGKKELMEIADLLGNTRQYIATKHTNQPMNFDQLTSAVIEAYSSKQIAALYQSLQESVHVFADLDKGLSALNKSVSDLSRDGHPNQNSEGVAPRIREVIFKVAKDVNGFRRLVDEIRIYTAHLDRLARETRGFNLELRRMVMALAKRGNLNIPKDWEEDAKRNHEDVIDELRHLLRPQAG